MSIFKNQSTPISRLNMSNFEEFAVDYARYAFELAYKCVSKKENAVALAISTLSRVVCVEAAEPGSESIGAEIGIQRAMKSFLSKTQRDRLVDDSIKSNVGNIYDLDVENAIIDGAVQKARKEMPRYAPVFSGTSGTMLILMLVVLIVAAIVFIWINPFRDKLTGETQDAANDIVYSTPAAHLNSQLLLDVESKVLSSDSMNRSYTGGLPVSISITGIDAGEPLSIEVTGDNGARYPVYQLEAGRFCFVADRNQIYNARISNSGGASINHYVSVYQLEKSFDGSLAAPFIAVKCGGESEAAPFDGVQGINAVSGGGGDGRDITGTLRMIASPSECSARPSDDGRSITFTGNGKTGIDSIELEILGADNSLRRHTIPVIIADNVPAVSTASREISTRHTPSKAGTLAGKLAASDADGDDVTFSLESTTNCSVMLSPSGSYIVRASEDFGGSEAVFSVTASDGFIKSSPVDIRVKLTNSAETADNYKFDVVCMAGDSGSYTLALPKTDNDGDPISWSISSPEDGQTENASISIDSGGLVYKMFDNINRNYTDTVYLYCTDGWATGEPVAFDISCSRNLPPEQAGQNRYTMDRSQGSIDINVQLSNDHAEDVCVIDEIISCTGGTVRQDDNWRNLIFTFVADGSADICTVRLRVRENGGDNTAEMEYYIIIE